MAFRFWLVVRPAHLFSSKFHNKVSSTKNERNRKLPGLEIQNLREFSKFFIIEILQNETTLYFLIRSFKIPINAPSGSKTERIISVKVIFQ